MTNIVTMPPLYTKQRAAFFGGERYAVTEASTKAGKTVGAIVWQANQVLTCPVVGHHWWLAPIYPQSRIAWDRASRMFQGLCRPTQDPLKLMFKNGATWWFKSAEVPDNLYGEDVLSCVFDEYTRAREDAWIALQSTLTATEGKCRLIGNVRGRGWGYMLARNAENGAPNWGYTRITADDAIAAGVLTQEAVDHARQNMSDQRFRELYYCEPTDDGGNPFGLQHIAACVGELSDADPVAFGVDLARKVDWTVCIGLAADGSVCRFDRWQRLPWLATRQRLAAIVGDTPAMVDATGVGDPVVEEMARDGMSVEPFTFTPKSKQQIMEGLSVAIQSREITVPDGPIRVELEQFEYSQRGANYYYSAPDGMHDDCVMALALAVHCWKGYGAGAPLIRVVAAGEHLSDDDEGWASWA